MQDLETHSRQTNLLREYIVALERQIAAIIQQQAETAKFQTLGEKDQQGVVSDLRSSRKQNQRLRIENGRLLDGRQDVEAMERGQAGMNELIARLHAEKEELLMRIEQMSIDNHNIFQCYQQLEIQANSKAQALQNEIVRSQEKSRIIQELKLQRQLYEKEKISLKQSIHEKQVQLIQLKKLIKNTQKNHEDQIKAYKSEIQRLKLIGMGQKITNQKEKFSKIEQELKTAKKQSILYQAEIERLICILNQQKSSAERQIQQKITQNTTIQQQLVSLKKEFCDLQVQLQRFKTSANKGSVELQQHMTNHGIIIREIKEDFQIKLVEKESQVALAQKQVESLKERLVRSEQNSKKLQSEGKQIQVSLKQMIKQLKLKQKSQLQEINRLKLQQILERQNKTSQLNSEQIFKQALIELNNYAAEQKRKIESLTKILEVKQRQITIIEESNTMLRQMIISAKAHEEASLKQLQSIRSTVCSRSVSRSDSTQNEVFPSGHHLRKMTGTPLNGSAAKGQYQNNFKKTATPHHSRTKIPMY